MTDYLAEREMIMFSEANLTILFTEEQETINSLEVQEKISSMVKLVMMK